jgi:hypothetical protein
LVKDLLLISLVSALFFGFLMIFKIIWFPMGLQAPVDPYPTQPLAVNHPIAGELWLPKPVAG